MSTVKSQSPTASLFDASASWASGRVISVLIHREMATSATIPTTSAISTASWTERIFAASWAFRSVTCPDTRVCVSAISAWLFRIRSSWVFSSAAAAGVPGVVFCSVGREV
jgi:hypothetical protein